MFVIKNLPICLNVSEHSELIVINLLFHTNMRKHINSKEVPNLFN